MGNSATQVFTHALWTNSGAEMVLKWNQMTVSSCLFPPYSIHQNYEHNMNPIIKGQVVK